MILIVAVTAVQRDGLTPSAGDSSVDQSKPVNDTAVNTRRSGSGYPSMYDVTPFPIQMADTNFPSQLAR